jgi:hypothetical protein
MARLNQLGDILGMSSAEVNAVHRDLASQAFRQQVRLLSVCVCCVCACRDGNE